MKLAALAIKDILSGDGKRAREGLAALDNAGWSIDGQTRKTVRTMR